MDHPNNLTPRAIEVLDLAHEEAERLRHNYLGTEHLLLGLTKLKGGVARSVFHNLELDLPVVRAAVEKLMVLETKTAAQTPRLSRLWSRCLTWWGSGVQAFIPYTPQADNVLSLAADEAKQLQLKLNYVGFEHLILGLLREGEGIGARALLSLGVNLQRAREAIPKLPGAEGAATAG